MAKGQSRWHLYFSRGMHPLLFMSHIHEAHRMYLKQTIGTTLNYMLRYEGATYFDKQEFRRYISVLRQGVVKGPSYLRKHLTNYRQFVKPVFYIVRKLKTKDPASYSTKELKSIMSKLFWHFHHIWVYTYVPVSLGEIAAELLYQELIKRGVIAEIAALALRLDAGTSIVDKEKRALLQLARLYKRSGIHSVGLKQKLERHRQRFRHLKTYLYVVREYTPSDVLSSFRRCLSEVRRGSVQRTTYRLRLTKTERRMANCVRLATRFREERLADAAQYHYDLKPYFAEYGKRLGLKYDELIYLTESEFLASTFKKREINSRRRSYVFLMDGKRFRVLTGREAKQWKLLSISQEELKGLPVFPGVVRGRVRIVTYYNINSLKTGEIVVTGITIPPMMSYLRRARAIVTNEGGIASHAAIVSRELKIPCVTQTKIATQVFKDGDFVEVDANNGLVRKINNK